MYVHRSSYEVPSVSSNFNENVNFSTYFGKYFNFMEYCSSETELFHANGRTDRWTDMTKLMVNLPNFAKEPKIESG